MVCVILDGCREQGVDEGRLSQTRFACDLEQVSQFVLLIGNERKYHDCECSSAFSDNLMPEAKSVEAGVCSSDTSKHVPLVRKLPRTAHVSKYFRGTCKQTYIGNADG